MSEKLPLISFKQIHKRFSKQIILDNLNLDINKNEIVAIIGKSGSGKSTLMKILIGFYKPDSGSIIYENQDLTKKQYLIRNIVGYVSQENSFYEKLSVVENLTFFAKLYKVKKHEIEDRIEHLLYLTKLENAKYKFAEKLSGGMKRKLEFAISLMHNPSILVLDEPFTGLDVEIREELIKDLKEIKNSGVTIIFLTHLLTTAQKIADRVLILNNHKIIKEIKKESILNSNFNLEREFLEAVKK